MIYHGNLWHTYCKKINESDFETVESSLSFLFMNFFLIVALYFGTRLNVLAKFFFLLRTYTNGQRHQRILVEKLSIVTECITFIHFNGIITWTVPLNIYME